ncbi:MAG TPA: hypothetical protein VL860_06980, partial [Planctomycetota bacterium]|nr:hypothetical protein [Planctomycetota bacterium]
MLIDTNTPKIAAGPVTREQFGMIDATAVACLQLEQYDEALRLLALKAPIDPNDYGLNANRSLVHARRALVGPEAAFASGMDQAIASARLAQAHSADPFHRDGLYIRVLQWLVLVHGDPTLRDRTCLLGYDLSARLAAGRERDRASHQDRSEPLSAADLAVLLGEEPGFFSALEALVRIDSLAVPDGLMALAELSEAMGDLEGAYFAYSRLEEFGTPYDRKTLETRLQKLMSHAHARVALAPGREIALPMDHEVAAALNTQCFERYLVARREAQEFTAAYDAFERQQLLKKPFAGAHKVLEGFYRQTGALQATVADEPAGMVDEDEAHTRTPFDPKTFWLQVAIWVPSALVLAVLLLVAVTGAIAAAMVEDLRLSRSVAVNATARDQGRLFAEGVEQLALLTIDDRVRENPQRTTLAGGWNGATRTVRLPGGGSADITVRDGGNCFNLNSVVDGQPGRPYVRRSSGVAEFIGLMISLEVPE